jgi:hypothetical protein
MQEAVVADEVEEVPVEVIVAVADLVVVVVAVKILKNMTKVIEMSVLLPFFRQNICFLLYFNLVRHKNICFKINDLF